MTKRMIEPEDWQVGDVFYDVRYLEIFKVVNLFKDEIEYENSRSHGIIEHEKTNNIINISATLRAKDQEIAELKKELAEKNAEKDPWCYDLDKMIDQWVLVQTHSGRYVTFDASAFAPDPEAIKAWMPIPEPKGNK